MSTHTMPLTVYPFTAPLLADLRDLAANRSYLPVNQRVAQIMRGVQHVLLSIEGIPLRTQLHRRTDGATCVLLPNDWIHDHGLELGTLLDIELAEDIHEERRRAMNAEAYAAQLMQPISSAQPQDGLSPAVRA